MRRRLIIILTFPFLASLFLIGWILYCIGGKPKSVKKGHGRKLIAAEKHANFTDEEITMGIIGETEEKIAA